MIKQNKSDSASVNLLPHVIPENWRYVPLGSVALLKNGYAFKSSTYTSGEKYKIITIANVQDGRMDIEKCNDIANLPLDIQPHQIINVGDVLISMTGNVGRVCRATEDNCLLNQRVGKLIPTNLDHSFLFQVLRQTYFQTSMMDKATGGAQGNLSISDITDFVVLVPVNKLEQQAIANALSDVDTLITSLNALIAKKRDIKQATMQELLTGRRRLPGFKVGWETRRVSSFGEVITGGTPSTSDGQYWHGDYAWITPTDISGHRDMFSSERKITEAGLKLLREVPKDSVLVTCIASIGKNAILRVRGACNQQINAVSPNKTCSSEFLFYLFEHHKPVLLSNAGITATLMLSKSTFSKLIFSIPSTVSEQTAIATVLSDMDAEILALEARRDKTYLLKTGMMQELLSGRIRLE